MPFTSLIKIHQAFIVIALIALTCIVSSKYLLIEMKQRGTGRIGPFHDHNPKEPIAPQEGEKPPIFEDEQGKEKLRKFDIFFCYIIRL